jgi:nucleoside-diphosphate-sugar epimerase
MAILVTGGGMVGSQIAAQLLERGDKFLLFDAAPPLHHLSTVVDPGKVEIVRGDLLSMPDLIHTIRKEGIDRIIHTAGMLLSGVRERPYDGINVNIMGTANVLEAARLEGVKRVVFTSTGLVSFGAVDPAWPEPVEPDFQMKMLTHRPKAVYPVTKFACEYIGLCYHQLYNVDFVTVRLGSVFGPFLGTASSIPGRTIDQFIRPAIAGKKVVVEDPLLSYGGGADYVYSKDTARACICACDAAPEKIKARVYTVSGGQFVTFQDLIDTVKKIFPKVEIELKHVSKTGAAGFPYPNTQPKDISRSRDEIGYVPEYPLERALKDYAEWLEKYQRMIV